MKITRLPEIDALKDTAVYTIEVPLDDKDAIGYIEELLIAARIFADRNNGQRRAVWRRSGAKGMAMHLFAKAERAFIAVMRGEQPDRDHLLDAINYAVFTLMLGSNIDGEWPWGG